MKLAKDDTFIFRKVADLCNATGVNPLASTPDFLIYDPVTSQFQVKPRLHNKVLVVPGVPILYARHGIDYVHCAGLNAHKRQIHQTIALKWAVSFGDTLTVSMNDAYESFITFEAEEQVIEAHTETSVAETKAVGKKRRAVTPESRPKKKAKAAQ